MIWGPQKGSTFSQFVDLTTSDVFNLIGSALQDYPLEIWSWRKRSHAQEGWPIGS